MFNKEWLRHAKVASAIGFLILIALVWFLGEWMGLVTVESRLGWILCIMLLWVGSLLVGQMLARRAGGLIEKMLRQQADDAVIHAGSDKRAEVTLLRQRLLSAIDTLKKSKLGSASGKAALYELPWYMIIGHPAAGKSTAILQSGLTFPFSDKNSIQGVGGTRNCDWFFSTEGVLLDTAGRYATQQEDRSEWQGFLKLLKKYRPKAPVNGILVAISLPELAQHHSEGFATYARQVKERIHEICHTFAMPVPVYLVFTKLDLLGGFTQFYQDWTEEERAQVWGCTFTANQGDGFHAANATAQQFELLYRGLVQAGEARLLQHRGNRVHPAHFAFPIEFHGLKDAVVKFVELLTENDPYHAKPLLRGFYFTSALQEGTPRIVAANRVQSQFGLSGTDAPAGNQLAPASYSYFLRELFRKVMFQDQHLIARQAKTGNSAWRTAAMATGVLFVAVMAGLWSWSYIGNQKLLVTIQQDRARSVKLAASTQLYDRLQALQILQNHLETLQSYRKDGVPWSIGMGLYQGDRLEQTLRQEYFAGLRKVMLLPIQQNLETTLAALQQSAPAPASPPAVTGSPESKAAPAQTPAKPARPKLRVRPQGGNNLPNIEISAADPGMRAQPVLLTRAEQQLAMQARWWHRTSDGDTLRPASWVPQPASYTKVSDTRAPISTVSTDGQPANDTSTPQTTVTPQLDASYNALKTYLMLYEPKRMEQAHLADQLPRYWRPYLEKNLGQYAQAEVMAVAERIIAFYVSQLQAPDRPLITPDMRIVNAARETLRGSFKKMSAQERVFNEIRARANTKYAPITVARILENKDLDIMAGSQMVEGAFTREAWDQYVKAAIDDASKGEIRSDDWVLAASSQDDLGQDGNSEKSRQAMIALYKQHYTQAWSRFLQGITVRDLRSPAQSASAMTRLADRQSSPVKLILVRAAYETSWDNPSELNRSLANAKQSVLERTAQLLSGGEKLEKNTEKLGEVGQSFAGIALLVKGDNAPINSYLDQLAKLKARMAGIASTNDPGGMARSLLQGNAAGGASELADSIAFVDNTLLAQVSPQTAEMVRPMLVRPLSQSYSALLGPVSDDINQAWANEVLPQWRALSVKYPFSDAASTATIAEINRFIKPNDGTVDRFINKYLAGLVQRKGNELVPRAWGELGLRFNPAFLSAVSRLSSLAGSQMQDSESIRFELQPQPTPGLSEIIFEIDGQEMRYRNGPQLWQPFAWNGNGQGSGARIQTVNYNGVASVAASHSGGTGLLRLLASARVLQDAPDGAQLSWPVRKGDDTQVIKVNFRVVSGVNPMQLNRLNKMTLPDRVTL